MFKNLGILVLDGFKFNSRQRVNHVNADPRIEHQVWSRKISKRSFPLLYDHCAQHTVGKWRKWVPGSAEKYSWCSYPRWITGYNLILEWVFKKVSPVFQVSSFDKNSRQKLILKSEKSCLILFFIKPVPESLLASCLTKSDAPKKSFYTLSWMDGLWIAIGFFCVTN